MEPSQESSVVPTTGSPVQSTSKGNTSPQLARIATQKAIPRKRKPFGSGLRKNPLAEITSPTTSATTSAVSETPPTNATLQIEFFYSQSDRDKKGATISDERPTLARREHRRGVSTADRNKKTRCTTGERLRFVPRIKGRDHL
jgi:hypothetical protein